MTKVGINDLKNNRSAYIRAVEAGQTVLVTGRGRVVAQLVPAPKPQQDMTQEEILQQLEREGRLTRATLKWTVPPRSMNRIPFDELMRGLDHDRADRLDDEQKTK